MTRMMIMMMILMIKIMTLMIIKMIIMIILTMVLQYQDDNDNDDDVDDNNNDNTNNGVPVPGREGVLREGLRSVRPNAQLNFSLYKVIMTTMMMAIMMMTMLMMMIALCSTPRTTQHLSTQGEHPLASWPSIQKNRNRPPSAYFFSYIL